jgi:hypothetical protein
VNKAAILDAVERLVWTAVQSFLATIIASPVFDSLGLGWQDALKVAGFAALLSVAKSILAIAATQNGTAQLGVNTYEVSP